MSASCITKTPTTPPRCQHHTMVSSSYMTPVKQTPGRMSSSMRGIPRMSPMPDRLRSGYLGIGGGGHHQHGTPYSYSGTPNRYRPSPVSGGACVSGDDDRFIPSRRKMNVEICRRALLTAERENASNGYSSSSSLQSSQRESGGSGQKQSPQQNPQETPLQKEFKRRMFSSLCNIPLDQLNDDGEPTGMLNFGSASSNRKESHLNRNPSMPENPYSHDTLRNVLQQCHDSYDSTGGSQSSVAKKVHRKVNGAPVRILDAPDIVDDYYLNLISWGKDNILAVALAQSVYLWNATTGDIQHLVSTEAADDYITSVSWCTQPGRSKYIAVGTNSNSVQLFDAQALRKVRTLSGHSGRVSSLAWSHQWLTSGARDSLILQHDIRSRDHIVSTYEGHEQEVCGLKWNEDGSTLASGGNENFLCLWDASMSGRTSFHHRTRRRTNAETDNIMPRLVLTQHKAAVKALDWCPFHRGLLASGGGTADRTIKFWNSSSGAMLNSIDTGSQVCSVLWSKHQREICSSHGYSENQLILWKYPTMTKIKELTGHTSRVLNMEMSPDGGCVVSAAADETLRFWNIFGTPTCRPSSGGLSMNTELSFGMPTIR